MTDSLVKDGEVTTTFDDVAEDISKDPKLYESVRRSVRGEIQDVVLTHLGDMTISDILREAIRASDVTEVTMLVAEMAGEEYPHEVAQRAASQAQNDE